MEFIVNHSIAPPTKHKNHTHWACSFCHAQGVTPAQLFIYDYVYLCVCVCVRVCCRELAVGFLLDDRPEQQVFKTASAVEVGRKCVNVRNIVEPELSGTHDW